MMDWKKELYRRARTDEWHQECLRRVNETEAAFLSIRDSLSPQQQEQLDNDIDACEELEHSLIYIVRKMKLYAPRFRFGFQRYFRRCGGGL